MNRQYLLRATSGLALAAALLAAPAMAADLPADTIALVNGKPLSAAALDDAVKHSGQPDSPALRNAQKSMLIARAVLAQQAANEGYASRPDVASALQQAHEATLIAMYMRDKVRPAAVTGDEVRQSYRSIVGSLGRNEYKARIIRLADDASAQDLLRQLKAGAAFDALASRHSLAPSRDSGGAMNWVSFPEPVTEGRTQGLPLAVAAAIASLPPGTVSAAPIAVDNARYLVKVEQVRPVTTPRYEEAAPGLRRVLEAQEMQRAIIALLADLLRKASISQ